ncbi:MAG: H4MPT-linked C1 transfer pathway protein [Candidatus Bathyarchaeota archaeon]|nr:H4MPT-linked C1 transfer pathway protein [Candidatus Bathyarchaeota archaeon]
MVNVLGLDIGGANTKATFLKTCHGTVEEQKTVLKYFPIWKNGKPQLAQVLDDLKNSLADKTVLDAVAVTITAELSDAYQTKKDGINHVLDCVTKVFGDSQLFVLDVEANLRSVKSACAEPLMVASANWAATGWMVSQTVKNCVVVDVGSTSTSIIPIVNGKVAAEGKTDLEKLQNGELVYSGSLRTNVATIVDSIPVKGNMTRVSSELFALSGDVHLIWGHITKQDYTAETADGRGKTKHEASARLARVVCADTNMLTEQEIKEMAEFVYTQQVEQISDGLNQVYQRVKPQTEKLMAIVAGLGRNFLARKAAEKVGFTEIVDLEKLLGSEASVVSPSVGVALLAASKLEGRTVEWKRS